MPSSGHGGRRRGSGRPRGADADAALATLAMIMKDNGEPAAVRVRAANDVLDRGYGRPPTQSIEVLTPPSEIPELPTQQEIEAELKRRGLPTVSELVAHERDRIRREAGDPASFAQQRRAAPPRDQLEMTVRQTCPAMDGNAQPSDLGDATSVELFHDSAGRSGAAPFQVKHSREDWRQRTFTM